MRSSHEQRHEIRLVVLPSRELLHLPRHHLLQ
jgi:hypothetical protein